MRLTVLNQFFPPDLAPTGRLAASLAEHRGAQGDEVTVVTGRGRYVPGSEAGARAGGNRARVHRVWTPRLGKGSLARRLIDYGWFYLAAAVRMLTLPRQDVVVSLTTPPFIAWAAVLHRWLHPRARLILWNMDSYPDALIAADVISNSGWAGRWLRWQNRLLLRRQDLLVCLDGAMEQLLTRNYAAPGRPLATMVIPNWEPEARIQSEVSAGKWVPAGVPASGLPPYVVHVGNAGYGHDFETAAEIAQVLQGDPVAFVYLGGGIRWSWLQSVKVERQLSHWHLIPYLPEHELMAAMAGACCALVTLRDSYLGVISPSKLHAALALGLPVLYFGPEGSNVDSAISEFGCGASLRHGDARGAVAFVRRVIGDGPFAEDLRRKARRAFESAYTERKGLTAFDALIQELGR